MLAAQTQQLSRLPGQTPNRPGLGTHTQNTEGCWRQEKQREEMEERTEGLKDSEPQEQLVREAAGLHRSW